MSGVIAVTVCPRCQVVRTSELPDPFGGADLVQLASAAEAHAPQCPAPHVVHLLIPGATLIVIANCEAL